MRDGSGRTVGRPTTWQINIARTAADATTAQFSGVARAELVVSRNIRDSVSFRRN